MTDDSRTITDLFAATDRGDLPAVTAALHSDVVVFFGNYEPIHGRTAYAALYGQMTGSLDSVRHEIHDIWRARENPDVLIARMTVHYTLPNGAVHSLPCCNVFHLDSGLIAQYQVYVDVSPVFAPVG
jgi:ketosteroid isomerase-like protein